MDIASTLTLTVAYHDDTSPINGAGDDHTIISYSNFTPSSQLAHPYTRDELISSVLSILNEEEHDLYALHPPLHALQSAARFFKSKKLFAHNYVESCLVPFTGPCSPNKWRCFTSAIERAPQHFLPVNQHSTAINPNTSLVESCFILSRSTKYAHVTFNPNPNPNSNPKSSPVTIPIGCLYTFPPDTSIAVGLPNTKCPFYGASGDKKGSLDDKGVSKYWYGRFNLSSRFEEGIMLDRQALFSLCPESVACHVATRVRHVIGNSTVVDCTAGGGGNVIQFGKGGSVIGIDLDEVKIKCTLNNAKIYEIDHNVDLIHGNCLQIIPILKSISCIYFSPEWTGPSYTDLAVFPASCFTPSLIEIARVIRLHKVKVVVVCFPRNISVATVLEFGKLINCMGKIEMEQNILRGKISTIHVYYWF
ncbi:hypothetical protein P9112_004883 [Eukaryota sp. TZLM1-RC]